MSTQVITRFAPSPTGLLHVGGARTALFAWAFARRHGGRFLIRLEDTDRTRSSASAAGAILADLAWLGLAWDAGPDPGASDPRDADRDPDGIGPFTQSRRFDKGWYEERFQALQDAGRAYEHEGALWFQMPGTDMTVEDEVLGRVTTPADRLNDFVIRKADGMPTYHFAVVVDDAAMGVSHVLRGQEHLANTPRHIALQQALGLPIPVYAHMPAILNPDGSKMSKRDKAKVIRQTTGAYDEEVLRPRIEELLNKNKLLRSRLEDFRPDLAGDPCTHAIALHRGDSDDPDAAGLLARAFDVGLPEINVRDFRASGYLPETLLNYLALLGWTPPEKDRERFDRKYLKEHFGFEGIGKSNARFDREKLAAFNAERLQEMPLEQFRKKLAEHLDAEHPDFERILKDPDRLAVFAEAYQPRSRTLSDPARQGLFFAKPDDEIVFEDKAVRKVLQKNEGQGLRVLEALLPRLEACTAWQREALEEAVEGYAAEQGLGMGKVAQPLRVALTGGTVSPGIHETLLILGRDASLARIRRCLALQSAEAEGQRDHGT